MSYRDEQVGNLVVDLQTQEDDALLEQLLVDVEAEAGGGHLGGGRSGNRHPARLPAHRFHGADGEP